MKKSRFLVILFITFLGGLPVMGDGTKNQIVVYGQGTTFAKADQAKILFNVVGHGNSLEKAFADARNKVSTVSKQLFELGLKESNLVTSSFHTGENYSKPFFSSNKDFQANLSVYVTVDDFKLLEPVILQISKNDVQSISQAKFSLKNKTPLMDESRTKAIEDAKRKVNEIAKNLGIKIGKAVYAEEIPLEEGEETQNNRRVLNFEVKRQLYEEGNVIGIFPDQLSIESVVKVAFLIESESHPTPGKAGGL